MAAKFASLQLSIRNSVIASVEVPGNVNIGVIGAGRMGAGIAQVCRAAGYSVKLHDQSKKALRDAVDKIESVDALLGVDETAGVLSVSQKLSEVARNSTILIETVTEDLDLKRKIFSAISEMADENAILATNTSSLPISRIGEAVKNQERFLGMHFWNPPWGIDLVEVVGGPRTSESTLQRAIDFVASLCMTPVRILQDIPGLIGNRLQHAMKREAIALVERGICDSETIDIVVKKGFGKRLSVLGPLEQSDLVGLDLTLRIHQVLLPDLDTSSEPSKLLRRKVAEGHTGMAAGRGFYEWNPEKAALVSKRLEDSLVADGRARIARLLAHGRNRSGESRT